MKKVFISLFLLSSIYVSAQRSGGVCISDSVTEAHESAVLHISSSEKGVLLPTLTLSERDLIRPLTLGLTVYISDNDHQEFQYWNGNKWIALEVVNTQKASIIAPLGGIVMYHGEFGNFDENGKGLAGTEMEGWQLCNGENGSPNLASLFVVGGAKEDKLEGKDPLYNKIGNNQRNPNTVSITKENIPPHNHKINNSPTITHSHTHHLYSDGEFSKDGVVKDNIRNKHTHPYITRSKGSRKKGELSRKNNNRKQKLDIGTKNLSQDLDLSKFKVSTEVAQVEFSVDDNVIKNYDGEDQKFDNRPQYYVLAYIIRIDDNIVEQDGYIGPFLINY